MRESINIWLVRVGLVISVDRGHGTRMGHITSTPATHPLSQAGYISVPVNAEFKKMFLYLLFMCVDDDVKINFAPFFSAG